MNQGSTQYLRHSLTGSWTNLKSHSKPARPIQRGAAF